MTGSGVAIAWIAVPPRIVLTAGVVTIPPPTPNRPDRTPAANPTATPSAASSRRHVSRSTARSMTSRSPLYAARLTAERSGNHRTSSISVS